MRSVCNIDIFDNFDILECSLVSRHICSTIISFFRPFQADMEGKTTCQSRLWSLMFNQLSKFQQTGFMCDLVLVPNSGKEFLAHSALLAAISPVFETLLRDATSVLVCIP